MKRMAIGEANSINQEEATQDNTPPSPKPAKKRKSNSLLRRNQARSEVHHFIKDNPSVLSEFKSALHHRAESPVTDKTTDQSHTPGQGPSAGSVTSRFPSTHPLRILPKTGVQFTVTLHGVEQFMNSSSVQHSEEKLSVQVPAHTTSLPSHPSSFLSTPPQRILPETEVQFTVTLQGIEQFKNSSSVQHSEEKLSIQVPAHTASLPSPQSSNILKVDHNSTPNADTESQTDELVIDIGSDFVH